MEQHANETQDRVRQRAYELWEQHGSREGHEAEFWHQAERELKGEASSSDTSRGVSANAASAGAVPDRTVLERCDDKAREGSCWRLVRNIPVRLICPLGR